ncbi:N,N-dimethylformamidase beta subunit family domain-containing protein [Yinghuangia sp. YIM S09857]|uniref:N,N-dimethylformamidase beta subunit family domain-containing protein n=1 Tax=Yinghuangia sp. YIM S09857 TaxID=3436929 RepID=UPI003F53B340
MPRIRAAALSIALLLTAVAACDSGGGPSGGRPTGSAASPDPNTAERVIPPGSMPADRVKPASTPCARVPWPNGWVAAENKRAGTGDWRVPERWGAELMGYLDTDSVACGETVKLRLTGPGPARVTAYRMGWYGGTGGREVWSSGEVASTARPKPAAAAPTYTVEANWPASLQFTVDEKWPPGYYTLVLRNRSGSAYGMQLTVRHEAGRAPLLFQAANLTAQAYNTYGGYGLYSGPRDTSGARSDRARVASFERPYTGSGYLVPYWYDVPMVQAIERTGIDVDYATDIDIDRRPSQLLRHKGLIIGGHNEYWTRRMYDGVEAARDSGVNIAFFGANTVYWHTRLESSAAGSDRRIAVYRKAAEDPLAAADPSQATVTWREAPLNRGEHSLVGATWGGLGVVGSFRVLDAGSWIFAGTGVHDGQVLANSLGGEYDMALPDDPATPPNLSVIAAAPLRIGPRATMGTITYYTAPSGAGVFSAGTTYWPCQLRGACHEMPVDPTSRAVLERMTHNILTAFAQAPAAPDYPSLPRPHPSPENLVATATRPEDVGVRP